MKTKLTSILLIVLLFGTAVNSYSQEDKEEMKLLFNPKHEKSSNGGYGAFQFGWTQVNGQNAITVGGRGAWIANHYFALGIAGNGFFSDSYVMSNNSDNSYSLYGGYGGILIEPIVASMSTVHVSFPMIFGGGGLVASSYNMYDMTYYNSDYYYNNYYDDVAPYFIFQPGVEMEINIVKFFRLALGVSYKITSGVDLQYKYFDDNNQIQTININRKAMDGFVATLTFKFGKF